MIKLGLTGYPLEHSLSPMLHEAALRAAGLQGSYSLYAVRPGDKKGLDSLVSRVRSGELSGLNVTIPHKQSIIPFLDHLTPPAQAIGAVNTIYLTDGKAVGDNTDTPGFLADVDRFAAVPASALILGTGGAARAVVYALWNRHCAVSVAARRLEQAQQLAERFPGIEAIALTPATLEGRTAGLVVNATPVGMFPHVEESPWPPDVTFPEGAAVYDLIYNPAETRLVHLARAAGLRAISGLGMLIEQAALAFELWTGHKGSQQVMLNAVTQSIP